METDPFARAKNEAVAVRFHDLMMIAADFWAPMAAVQRVLPSGKLKPTQVMAEVATVTMMAMEYRRIDVLVPYNEFGVVIPVLYQADGMDQELPGLYVYHLPVTTQQACDAGIKYYGYPKFVAEIGFEHAGEVHRCRVQAGGKDIITLEVRQLATTPQSWDFYTYTVKDNHLLRTLVQVQGHSGTATVNGGALYTLGDHPVAEEVRALGMNRTSVGHRYAPQLQSLMYRPGQRLLL